MAGRTFEVSNAPALGEGSVVEATAQAAQNGAEGLLYASREAPPVDDLTDFDAVRAALRSRTATRRPTRAAGLTWTASPATPATLGPTRTRCAATSSIRRRQEASPRWISRTWKTCETWAVSSRLANASRSGSTAAFPTTRRSCTAAPRTGTCSCRGVVAAAGRALVVAYPPRRSQREGRGNVRPVRRRAACTPTRRSGARKSASGSTSSTPAGTTRPSRWTRTRRGGSLPLCDGFVTAIDKGASPTTATRVYASARGVRP